MLVLVGRPQEFADGIVVEKVEAWVVHFESSHLVLEPARGALIRSLLQQGIVQVIVQARLLIHQLATA